MASRLMRAARLLAAAMLVATVAAAVARGTFEAMQVVLIGGGLTVFVLMILAALLSPWQRTATAGRFLTRCVIVAALAIPLSFVAARGVVAVNLWRAKRYIEAEVVPRIEEAREAQGAYPRKMTLPARLDGFNYFSDGKRYSLGVMDPEVCGLVTRYSSVTRKWTQSYDPCYY